MTPRDHRHARRPRSPTACAACSSAARSPRANPCRPCARSPTSWASTATPSWPRTGSSRSAGLVVTRGRGGHARRRPLPRRPGGLRAPTPCCATSAPATRIPELIPDPSTALAAVAGRPVLYGEPVIDRGPRELGRRLDARRSSATARLRLTVTSGAVDAVERLLAQALARDDAVALEDPCFLASIHTVRLGGYRAVPVPVDDEGMTVDGLRAALAQGVRAVVCTPRAQNPTGASLSAGRAAQLRAVLAEHPYVLVIEDDHFSMLSQRPVSTRSIGPDHRRWALVRSVSKFLGPDMCLAVVASDPRHGGAARDAPEPRHDVGEPPAAAARRWHSSPTTMLDRAFAPRREHYAERNAAFARRLARHGHHRHRRRRPQPVGPPPALGARRCRRSLHAPRVARAHGRRVRPRRRGAAASPSPADGARPRRRRCGPPRGRHRRRRAATPSARRAPREGGMIER